MANWLARVCKRGCRTPARSGSVCVCACVRIIGAVPRLRARPRRQLRAEPRLHPGVMDYPSLPTKANAHERHDATRHLAHRAPVDAFRLGRLAAVARCCPLLLLKIIDIVIGGTDAMFGSVLERARRHARTAGCGRAAAHVRPTRTLLSHNANCERHGAGCVCVCAHDGRTGTRYLRVICIPSGPCVKGGGGGGGWLAGWLAGLDGAWLHYRQSPVHYFVHAVYNFHKKYAA